MTIRSATGFAIAGLSIALFMSLCGQFLLPWLYQHAEFARERLGIVQSVYFSVQSILHYGTLLLFFTALYSRQNAQATS